MMDRDADVVVIGAGVIGCAIALELVRSGRSVVCVDKGPGPGAGSTSASSALIRFSYSTMDSVLTAWESAAHWEAWGDYLGMDDPDGMASFIRTGMLIFDEPNGTMPRVTELWDEVGIPYERLDAVHLAERFPALDTGSYFPPTAVSDPSFGHPATGSLSAVFDPNAGYIDDPLRATGNIAHAARRYGAEFVFHRRAVSIELEGQPHRPTIRRVHLDDGSAVTSPVVVNAAGPHSAEVNRLVDVQREMNIGHWPLRQEVFVAPSPGSFSLVAGAPIVVDLDLGQYFRPQPGGTLLAGGTEAACDPLEWIDDADRFNEHPTVERFETSMLRVAKRMPEFGVPNSPVGLAALYDVSDDWLPIYDRSCLNGWFMACATSGNQFKNAPLAGKFMLALIEAASRRRNHDVKPVTFVGPRTGRTINLAAFSRNRPPANTSGTVMG